MFARSTCYKVIHAIFSKRQIEANKLKEEIRKIYADSKGSYVAPKIYKILKAMEKILA